METFSLFAICVALAWVVYWAILRPTLMSVVGDELFALKARMDWAIIENMPNAQSESAQQIDFVLTRSNEFENWITFGQIISASYINRKAIALRRDEWRRKFEENPPWLRDAQEKCARLYLKAALLNSPLWWPILPFFMFSTLLSNQASMCWQNIQIASGEVLKKTATAKLAPLTGVN